MVPIKIDPEMKKIILLLTFFVSAIFSFAQEIRRSILEDSMIGWIKIYNFKGAKEPLKVDDKSYSVAQLSVCDSFANWMQASYFPKGGLGDVKRSVAPKLSPYNKHTAALPQSYGAYAHTYYFLKYNSQHKLVPATSHSVIWGLMANKVPSDWEIRDISTSSQCYFTLPSYADDGEAVPEYYDLTKVENLKPYMPFFVKNVETGGVTSYVLLSKDRRSPFVKISRGEYLQLIEAAIPRVYEEEKKKLYEREQGNQKNIAFFTKVLDEKRENRMVALKKIKAKYKDRLDEPALTSRQPSLNDLVGERDIFNNGYLTDAVSTSGRVPVYKVDSLMAALCKKDTPQWILTSWWWAPNDPLEKHMHESIINNFNFAYVYNFFFDPAKVKGQPYKPLRSPLYKEAVVISEASEASKKSKADKNNHFFEDFSTTGIGKKPLGWNAKLNLSATSSTVIKLDGTEGNWAVLAGHELIATQIKNPLPQNFTLSYDLIAAQNFTWGAKGLTLQLAKETSPDNAESYLKLKIRPGYDGKEGEVTFETKFPFPPGYLNATKWMAAPGFSNNKKINRITVIIKKVDETLQLFIDKTKIAEYEKAIPAALLFNALSFTAAGNAGENDKFYISNIKITKD
jgi:hypothetical protein